MSRYTRPLYEWAYAVLDEHGDIQDWNWADGCTTADLDHTLVEVAAIPGAQIALVKSIGDCECRADWFPADGGEPVFDNGSAVPQRFVKQWRSRSGFIPPVVTFNWTELRFGDLVGDDGEDLGISGVRLRGNLASVGGTEHLAGKAGTVRDDIPGRWFATDLHGQLWVMLSPVERAWQGLEPLIDEDGDDPDRTAAVAAFDAAVDECGGEHLGGGAYTFSASGGEWIYWNGEWEFHPEN